MRSAAELPRGAYGALGRVARGLLAVAVIAGLSVGCGAAPAGIAEPAVSPIPIPEPVPAPGPGGPEPEPEPAPELEPELEPEPAPEPEPEPEPTPLEAILRGAPACAAAIPHCYGIHLHVVVDDDGTPVQDAGWIRDQLVAANDRFATAAASNFMVVEVSALGPEWRAIVSRGDRDRLGRTRLTPGVIDVFVVGSLADVDGPGEIRGVHWRDRSEVSRRWIILSAIAGSMTLTHELGHFFSLPHSRYPESVMNKRPGGSPWATRGFHPREAAKMIRARAAMAGDRTLIPQPRAQVPEPAAVPENPPGQP